MQNHIFMPGDMVRLILEEENGKKIDRNNRYVIKDIIGSQNFILKNIKTGEIEEVYRENNLIYSSV